MLKCCAFTCSYNRPQMLRFCIEQMRNQTYPIDHYIYMSGNVSALPLINSTKVNTGPNLDQHSNHLAALPEDEYDLYFKIDDDDIYGPEYVENIVNSYDNSWDYSGGYSNGLLLGSDYRQGILKSLCVDPTAEEIAKGVIMYMPSTLVLNSTALYVIKTIPPERIYHSYEDIVWRSELWDSPMRFFLRESDLFTNSFTYVVHGKNISTSGWL